MNRLSAPEAVPGQGAIGGSQRSERSIQRHMSFPCFAASISTFMSNRKASLNSGCRRVLGLGSRGAVFRTTLRVHVPLRCILRPSFSTLWIHGPWGATNQSKSVHPKSSLGFDFMKSL